MSTGEFSGVDHDLLADYLGGALDGTPEEAEVARLVAQDPAWAQAHALLAPAVDGVRAELAEWGGMAPEMPPALADRILAALDAADLPETAGILSAEAGEADPGDHDLAGVGERSVPATEAAVVESTNDPDPASVGEKPAVVPAQPLGGPRRPGGTVRPGQERSVPSRPARRRRRWARVAGPVALAAMAVVGLGALQLSRPDRGDDAATGTALSERNESPVVPEANSSDSSERAAAGEPDRSAVSAAAPFRIAGPPQLTGTDYTPEALTKEPPVQPFATKMEPEVSVEGGRLAAPGDLARLGDQTALSVCLAEISTEHGSEPLVFDVVDYARFQGRPALVVRFTDGSGANWAWVSGPECGVPGSGSDARYRTRVG